MRRKTFGGWQDRSAWAAVLIGLVLLLLPGRTKLAATIPLQTVLLAPLRGLGVLEQRFGHLESENRRLSDLAAELAVENARLRSTLGRLADAPVSRYELVRAPVISRDIATLERWLVISRGRSRGVFPGATVLAPEGVVGKIVAAGLHQALVQTVLDPESRVSVTDVRSHVPALCRSFGRGLLSLDYAPKGSDILPNDTIATAGLGRVFPRGLALGVVVSADDSPSELFKTVLVRPFVDVPRLDQVFVMSLAQPAESLWTDPWLDNLAPEEIAIPHSAEER